MTDPVETIVQASLAIRSAYGYLVLIRDRETVPVELLHELESAEQALRTTTPPRSAFRAGAEAMREEAAKLLDVTARTFRNMRGGFVQSAETCEAYAQDIRALPLPLPTPPTGDER